MVQTKGHAVALLTRVDDHLRAADRARRQDDLALAEAQLVAAKDALAGYDRAVADTHSGALITQAGQMLPRTTAKLTLIEAALYAHLRTHVQNAARFAAARAATVGLPDYFSARVDVCLGAVLTFEGDPTNAIAHLRSARTRFVGSPNRLGEEAQATYLLARALLRAGQNTEAIELLHSLAYHADRVDGTSSEYYVAGAMILLATLTWSVWSRRGRKQARRLRRTVKGYSKSPRQREEVAFIGRYGFLANRFVPERRWLEI